MTLTKPVTIPAGVTMAAIDRADFGVSKKLDPPGVVDHFHPELLQGVGVPDFLLMKQR